MSHTDLLLLLLAIPLITSLLAFACRALGRAARMVSTWVHFAGISLLLIVALMVVCRVAVGGEILAVHNWLHIDSLSALFLAILGVIGFITGLYSLGYMRHEVNNDEITVSTLCK